MIVADGKPRPAVIVQADAIPTPTNVLVTPLTSDLTDTRLYRVQIEPTPDNGLRATSLLMTDRTGPVRRDRIDVLVGELSATDMQRLSDALAFVFDLTS